MAKIKDKKGMPTVLEALAQNRCGGYEGVIKKALDAVAKGAH